MVKRSRRNFPSRIHTQHNQYFFRCGTQSCPGNPCLHCRECYLDGAAIFKVLMTSALPGMTVEGLKVEMAPSIRNRFTLIGWSNPN
jgi:hypothetical protein